MPITVHHLDNSRSHRVLWLLEELGLDYAIREWKRDPKTLRAPVGLREIHPLGKAPVVEVDGSVYAESGALIENLLARFGEGRLIPDDPTELEHYRFWMHYAEGSLAMPLLVKLITSRLRTGSVPMLVRPIARGAADKIDASYTSGELDRHCAFLESHLATHTWFAGTAFSAADVQMSFPLEAAVARRERDLPGITGFLERIHARPAYQRAIERGGPLSPFA